MANDIKVDLKSLLTELNDVMDATLPELSTMTDEEVDDAVERIVYLNEKLVYNIVDWSLSNLKLISRTGLKCVVDVRAGLTSISEETLRQKDAMAPLIMSVIIKLDSLDPSKRMGDILVKALSL